METITDIISILSSNEIITSDGLVTFIFEDQPARKGKNFKKLIVKKNGNEGESYEGHYRVEELRTEDGYWILEFTYNDISSTVQFFSVEEAVEELISLDMSDDN
jgi:hypothetical protein